MNISDHILAKSDGTTLYEHLQEVARFSEIAADYYGLEKKIARLGGILHDVGKASPLFQRTLVKNYRSNPMDIPFRHEIASLFFLPLLDRNMWNPIIDMVVAHHKSIYTPRSCNGPKKGILDLMEMYDEDLFPYYSTDFDIWSKDAIAILTGLDCSFANQISLEEANDAFEYAVTYCKKMAWGWSEWKGLLMGADHFASALNGMPFDSQRLFSKPDLNFYNRSSNLYPLSLIPSDKIKSHTFVKAPTGAGKTDFLIKRCRGRVFYTLPFQASINAMFERIKKDLGEDIDIRLLHASSKITLDQKQAKLEEKMIQDKFGAAIKVLTPHQIASIVFGTNGYEAVLFDLKGCDIILDEIHTYSDMVQAIVLKIVEVLKWAGCHIHIGTATMPTMLEEKILQILGEDDTQIVTLPKETLDTFNRHLVHKIESMDLAYDPIRDALALNQKVLLVSNRVDRAQLLFRQMEEEFPDVPKMLIHSRFKREDRNRLERNLKEVFNENDSACIVVSTQVVEVSLDISFDLMVTEVAPIDAMIQRFGRINRKRTPETIGKYKPVYVLAPPQNKRDTLPYSLEVLQKSYDTLQEGVLKERDLQQRIDQVYPDIPFIDIDLDSVLYQQEWQLKKLWHKPKSALLEKLDIESAACILYSDLENYKNLIPEQRAMLEIPINLNTIRWKGFIQCNYGSNPFLIPDACYSPESGLELSRNENQFNPENQFI